MDELPRERQRLVRLASATDEPIPEVLDALKSNQERAKALDRAVAIAARPPIDPSLAERLEASAVEQIQRMREQLNGTELRQAFRRALPERAQI